MKSLNKTETLIFLSVVCSLFPKAIFLTLLKTIFEITNILKKKKKKIIFIFLSLLKYLFIIYFHLFI